MKRSLIILLLSIITALFWYIGATKNVYADIIIAGIFEFLWLFMLVAAFVLPVLTIISWVKENFRFWPVYLLSLLINIGLLSCFFLFP